MAVRFVDRWIVWERMGREKRMDCVRDNGRGAEGEGNAHQRGIELGIPCEDHRGIRSHGDSSDSFIRWDVRITGFRACSLCLLWRSRTSGFAGRQTLPPFDGRWCIKGCVWIGNHDFGIVILFPKLYEMEERYNFSLISRGIERRNSSDHNYSSILIGIDRSVSVRGVIDAGFMDRLEYKREDVLVQIVIHNGRKRPNKRIT